MTDKQIELLTVVSSQIEGVGFDSETSTLAIRFKSSRGFGQGSLYHYANVPADVHAAMLAAESIGAFFGANIKKETEKYPFTKIQADPIRIMPNWAE